MWSFRHDQMDPHDSVPVRTVKVLLQSHIPLLSPVINSEISEGFDRILAKGYRRNGNCECRREPNQ
jgi:hypothetical protein